MMVKKRENGKKSVKKVGALPSNRSTRYAGAMTKHGNGKKNNPGKHAY